MQLKGWVELLFLFGLALGFCFNQQGLVSAQQTLFINSSANCLFVNNLNSKVNVLKRGGSDQVPDTNISLRPKLSITNIGYNPTGDTSGLLVSLTASFRYCGGGRYHLRRDSYANRYIRHQAFPKPAPSSVG